MMLTNLAAVARRTGYPVVEVTGWKTRTTKDERDRPRSMASVDGVTCHHTANQGAPGDAPSLGTVTNGRPGLQGPLAHYVLGVSGTIYVVAAGHCNHAGESLKPTYANSHRIGIEAEAVGVPGNTKDWPPKQMESYQHLCAALADEFDFPVTEVRAHKETCAPPGRKSDPTIDMPKFRKDVAAVNLKNPPRLEPIMLAPEDIEKIAAAVVRFDIPNKNVNSPDSRTTMGGSIVDIERTQDVQGQTLGVHTQQLAAILTEQAELRAVVSQQAALLTQILAALQPPK